MTNVENYDATAINDQLNDQQRITVVIGDIVMYRSNVKLIVPENK
ncbi:hypothetical protein [Fictibacillus sp. WQ 8-8]|nr:hypothetical protein [Fictibacillus sp. WQ 8-8]